MHPSMAPRQAPMGAAVAATERRRLFVVAIGLSCFLGIITASLWQRPEMPLEKRTGWSVLSHSGPRQAGKFQHILDEFEDLGSTEKRTSSAVDASALNDLQNELRLLKRPLRVLIHQLEPNGPPTAPPTPPPTTSTKMSSAPDAPISEPLPPPVMHQLVYHNKWPRDKTIFMTLVATVAAIGSPSTSGDVSRCAQVVDALFAHAANPSQLRVGIVEVHPDGTNFSAIQPLSGCVNPKYSLCNQSKYCVTDFIRVRRVHASQVPGQWDRFALAASMYRNEAHVLLSNSWQKMLDGVTGDASGGIPTLPQGWDNALISTLAGVEGGGEGRRALTAWLPRTTTATPMAHSFPCNVSKSAGGQWSFASGPTPQQNGSSSTTSKTHLVSTDLLFARGKLLVDIPIDPRLHAEPETAVQVALSLRMFAAGYRTYALGRTSTLPLCNGSPCTLLSEVPQDDSTSSYVNDVLSHGWDDNTTSTPTKLVPRFSVTAASQQKFWKALQFNNNAGHQC